MSEPWVVALVLLVMGVLFVVACYIVPQRFVQRYHLTAPKDKAEVVDAYRKTFAQVIGGLALAVTFAWTIYRDNETLDQGKKQLNTQQFFQRAQLSNQQFVEGAKLLKEDVGPSAAGVNALGQVAATQPEFQSPVVTTLIAFIKSGKMVKSQNDLIIPDNAPGTIPANIQAALSVIAKRNQSTDEQITSADKVYRYDGSGGNFFRLNLYRAYLVRARFSGLGPEGAFRNVSFQGASLYGADFHGLDLSNTGFDGSRMADWEAYDSKWTPTTPKEDLDYIDAKHLFTVNFEGAKLIRAGFDRVRMGGANLKGADLEGASFWKADLSRADLTGAKNLKNGTSFYEATLTDAVFAETDLESVNFRNAKLHGTDFTGAKNVEKADFTDACSDRHPLFDAGGGGKLKFKSCNGP